jgi:multimeric flavodoxin WrbA
LLDDDELNNQGTEENSGSASDGKGPAASDSEKSDEKPSVVPFKYTESGGEGADRTGIVQKGTEKVDSRVKARGAAKKDNDGKVDSRRIPVREVLEPRKQPSESAPTLLLISGSPRKHTSVSLIDLIESGAQDAGVRTQRFLLCEKRIDPCIGCNACTKTGSCVFAGKTTSDRKAFADDYLELIGLLDRTDGLAVVAPVYFSGPTAQLKALYDRFQPYWARKYVLGQPFPKRRPSQLFIVGTGGDPHGHEPIITISRSALQIAGFELDKINNFVGYLAPQDSPKPLTEEEMAEMSHHDIAVRKAAVEKQEEFRTRAVEAGRAFGRLLLMGALDTSAGSKDENETSGTSHADNPR